jgi:hypothetical protein
METLDAIAQRYGVLPHELIGETEPFKAFEIDLWAAKWGSARDNNPHLRPKGGRRGGRS